MTTSQLGTLCALLSSFTWALGTSVYSRLTRTQPAFAVNLTRSLVALPLFVLMAFVAAGGIGQGLADFASVGAASAAWFFASTVASYALGDAVFLLSAQSLGVPGALAISSSYPIWTAAAGWLFEGQALRAVQIVGLIVTLAGVTAVILFAPGRETGGSEGTGELVIPATSIRARFPIKGVALALLTSLFWAMNGYSVFRGGRGLSMPVANSVRMAIAIAISPLIGRILVPGAAVFLPFAVLRRYFWVFGIEAFLGSAFFVYGLCHSPLAIGATLSALAPVISVPFSLALRVERFSFGRTAGVALTVVGLGLLVG